MENITTLAAEGQTVVTDIEQLQKELECQAEEARRLRNMLALIVVRDANPLWSAFGIQYASLVLPLKDIERARAMLAHN